MDKLAIITPKSREIETYLKNNMDVEIITFNDIYELDRRIQTAPLRVDTILLRDAGLQDTKYNSIKLNEAGALLLDILQRPLFEVDKLVYLNQTPNKEYRDVMEFIAESKRIKTEIILSTQDNFQAIMIKNLLIKSSLAFEDIPLTYKHVIKRKRGKMEGKSKYLNEFETDKAVVLEYNSYAGDTQINKKQLKKAIGEDIIETSDIDDEERLEEIDVTLNDETPTELKKPTKIVGVIGESKSGVTTTSMILGASGSVYHKTLLIDMNYDNLGLSYLAEKTLLEDEVNNIKMSNLISGGEGIRMIKEESFNKKQLHILSLDMPSQKEIDKSEYGFIISNIINTLRDSYAYIILDIPINDLIYYRDIALKLDDIIMCTPPYMNNIVSMLNKLEDSPIVDLPIFDDIKGTELRKIKCLRTRVFSVVNEGINPINKAVFDRYSEVKVGRTMKVTGIYTYSAKNYIDTVLFQQLLLGED